MKVSWHVPNDDELEFALQVFKELIEPTVGELEKLLEMDRPRDAVWRNDFCRHLCLVRNAFSGIPTMMQAHTTKEQIDSALKTSDFLYEIPEMIALVPTIESSFSLKKPEDPRYQYLSSLRHRFGQMLHKASVSLLQQGEENTVDAVRGLVNAIRTYLLEYGDSRDSYYVNESSYTNEKNVARQYSGQKVWPRAVLVRRARYYHSVRLHWNSMDRIRTPLDDSLIDDLVEWSMWHYAGVRELSQSLLESLCSSYDGVRTRALPKYLKALEPGNDDDRIKGALWSLNNPSFGRYGISDPTLATELLIKILRCQHNEKPTVQELVSVVSENCINNFPEPCYVHYDLVPNALNKAAQSLQAILPREKEHDLVIKCRLKRTERVQRMDAASRATTDAILNLGNSSSIHWRYAIVAIRCIRTLIRRDQPMSPQIVRYVLERTYDSHPNIRYYAQRGVMKSLRYIKLRTLSTNPEDVLRRKSNNPLKKKVPVQPSHSYTQEVLHNFKVPVDLHDQRPIFLDKELECSLAWKSRLSLYCLPHSSRSTFQPWEAASQEAVSVVREIVSSPRFWQKLQGYLSEENHEQSMVQDNVSCVKSIFQLLEDEPLKVFKPVLMTLLDDKEPDKQRAGAELLAGVLNGSKHWPLVKQKALWEWARPVIRKIFAQNLKTDTLTIWTSFIEYVFYNKDPRRLQDLVDDLVEGFRSLDFNSELSFDVVKVLALYRAFYEELGFKFSAWSDEVVDRCWQEIHCEHDEARAYIGDILAFTDRIKCQPRPSIPRVDVFVKECRVLPVDFDIMGMRGTFHQKRIQGLVESFKIWREERIPGIRAFQSKYDRVGITICKWLFQSLHDIHAISAFDYIVPLMPGIFRFTEVNDDEELTSRASVLLVRMCGVTPPRALVASILDAIFEAIQSSPSWKVRLKALPLVQVFYFRQVPLISEAKVVEILEALCKCLDDEVVEVREMAATTLSGVLRLSPKRSVLTFKNRFVRLAKNSHIPSRHDPGYQKAIRQRHAAILGICALVDSYPYTVEKWMPELLTNVLAEHTYDPIPISTTVRKCASNFKKTHQDTWHEDSKRFNEDQLAALSTLLTGSSYYA